LPELPRVREWGKASRSHLNARWRERSDRQNLGWWRDYFEFIRSMDWLMGRVPSKDRRDPFRADLLWLSGAQNMDKVLSGRYVRGQPPRASPGRDEPKPRTYEEAKALEHRAIIDAEFRQIGGDSS
jgi:hypothetical protein